MNFLIRDTVALLDLPYLSYSGLLVLVGLSSAGKILLEQKFHALGMTTTFCTPINYNYEVQIICVKFNINSKVVIIFQKSYEHYTFVPQAQFKTFGFIVLCTKVKHHEISFKRVSYIKNRHGPAYLHILVNLVRFLS